MDDIGGSRENEARCKKVTSEIDAILSTGQFQVEAWHSNNKNVNLSDEERPDFLGHKWITIDLRIDLQELWSAGYSWDEILPEEIRTNWIRNIQILNQLLTYEFDRKLKPDNAVGLPEIHGFAKTNFSVVTNLVFAHSTPQLLH